MPISIPYNFGLSADDDASVCILCIMWMNDALLLSVDKVVTDQSGACLKCVPEWVLLPAMLSHSKRNA